MLETRDRRLFLESLKPPEGYRLDRAIGTTFTLDMRALMAAPLAFAMFDSQEEQDTEQAHPAALLEAIRRHAEHIHIFCQAGKTAALPRNRPLLAYLEQSVIAVRAPKGGLFHPKVWVLRFEPTEPLMRPVCYRVLILSRNLTFDRCWDAMVALEGQLVDRKSGIRSNQPLADFIAALPKLAVHEPSAAVTQAVLRVQDELRRVAFELPPDIDELKFWPLGLKAGASWPFEERIDRMLVVSPFVSATLLERLVETSESTALISRVECLDAVAPEMLRRFTAVHVISDAAFAEPSEGMASELANSEQQLVRADETALVGLHAKIFVAEAGHDARLWLGSANATDGAFGNNVEFLVELRGRKSKCGIEKVLGAVGNDDGLRALQQSYQSTGVAVVDVIEDGLRASIDSAREALVNARLHFVVEPSADGRFTLSLCPAHESGLALRDGVSVHCWPATLGEGFGTQVTSYSPGATLPLARSTELALAELTSFLTVHVVATAGEREMVESFALNLPLSGAPADRLDLLLRTLLKTRNAVMHYLMFLLAESGAQDLGGELSGSLQLAASGGPDGKDADPSSYSSIPLLEAMLQALHREPAKLDFVDSLVSAFARTPEGRQLLPEGFDAVWLPILAARKELST